MNELIRLPLLPGVRLTYLQTDKFKTDYISLNLLRPLRRDEAPLGALLPSVLLRGTEQHPDMEAICARLDSLYGTGIDAFARKKGEVQIIGFYMDFVDDALSPDGSEVLRGESWITNAYENLAFVTLGTIPHFTYLLPDPADTVLEIEYKETCL